MISILHEKFRRQTGAGKNIVHTLESCTKIPEVKFKFGLKTGLKTRRREISLRY